jgi:hypothetical protein
MLPPPTGELVTGRVAKNVRFEIGSRTQFVPGGGKVKW